MTTDRANLFTRDDTFFGICQGLGEDLRIPPNLLRVALALGMFWNPLAMIALYAGAGVLVLVSRLIVPEPSAATPAAAQAVTAEPADEPQPDAIPLAA